MQPAKTIVLIATSLVVGTISTAALAASKTAADRDVKALMNRLDKDHNGVVSKDEFLDAMGREFDRLDVNKNSTLEPKELRPMLRSDWHRNWGYTQ
jgi:Ca2+-binding EF-hand superfamily protein